MPEDALQKRFEIGEVLLDDVLFETHPARDRLFRRDCALHILKPQWAANKPLGSGLLESIQLAAEAKDRTLPAVQLARQINDGFVVVTDSLPRWLLSRVLETAPAGKLKERQAVVVGRGLAKALRAIHADDLVHGNIRPEVVWLDDALNPKLLWSGVANAVALHQNAKRALLESAKHFTAPELLSKTFATKASDIYGLGALLYFLVTGKPPIEGDTISEIAVKLRVRGIVSPAARGATLSTDLEACIMKCLAYNPSDRYASASEVLGALDKCAGEYAPEADNSPSTTRTGRRQPTPPAESKATKRAVPPPAATGKAGQPGVPPGRREEPAGPEKDQPAQRQPNVFFTIGCVAAVVFALTLAVLAAAYFYYLHTTPPDVAVPDVVGKPLQQAQAILSSKELKSAVDHRVFNSSAAADTVVETFPAAGSKVKARHKTVRLVVSAGTQLATVPDLQLKTAAQARDALEKAGLQLGEVIPQPAKSDYGEGRVQAQVPTAGTRAEKNTSVDLYVASNKVQPVPADQTQTLTANVAIQIPSGGTSMHSVRIEVLDADGEHTVYQSYHIAGERVSTDISWRGDADIAVYVDEILAKHERYRSGELQPVD